MARNKLNSIKILIEKGLILTTNDKIATQKLFILLDEIKQLSSKDLQEEMKLIRLIYFIRHNNHFKQTNLPSSIAYLLEFIFYIYHE